MRLVVTYDISDDNVRGRLFRLLQRYGAWKQYSVFEMQLMPVQRVRLEHDIRGIITVNDRVRIYEVCERCISRIKDLGEPSPDRASNIL